MNRKLIYIAGVCMIMSAAISGCSSASNANTNVETDTDTNVEANTDTNVDENVETNIGASAAASVNIRNEELCVYGPVSEVSDDSVTIDNQSGLSSQGNMVITYTAETPIFDAKTGDPVDMTGAEVGTTIYAYIGEAMTMSEPPITNGEFFFVNAEDVDEMPVYAAIKSVKQSNKSEETVYVTTENGTEYTVNEETRIMPYLTRNIVTAEDIESGKKCVIWADKDGIASKIVLFQ